MRSVEAVFRTALAIGAVFGGTAIAGDASTSPPGDAWLHMRDATPLPLAERYRQLRAARDAELGAVGDLPAWSPAYATMYDRSQPGATREWHFEADASGTVRRAYALSNLPGARYGVLVEVACEEDRHACEAFRARLRDMPAPKPVLELSFDPDANALATSRYTGWARIVMTEACTDRPVARDIAAYPPAAIREGAQGTVQVQILFNRCGQVRDASVRASSGNRDLDRAAVMSVRQWNVGRETVHSTGGSALVPVNYSLDASPPAPAAAASP